MNSSPCINCRNILDFSQVEPGTTVACPFCGKQFHIPEEEIISPPLPQMLPLVEQSIYRPSFSTLPKKKVAKSSSSESIRTVMIVITAIWGLSVIYFTLWAIGGNLADNKLAHSGVFHSREEFTAANVVVGSLFGLICPTIPYAAIMTFLFMWFMVENKSGR